MSVERELALQRLLVVMHAADIKNGASLTIGQIQHELAAHGIVGDTASISELLATLVYRLYVRIFAEIDQPNYYVITPAGVTEANRIRREVPNLFSAANPEVKIAANDAIAQERVERLMTVCVSEQALDQWWSQLDSEVKADVFTTYMEDLEEDEPVTESAL